VTQVDVREVWSSVTRRIWGRPDSWFSQIHLRLGARQTDSFDGNRTAQAVWADINYEGPLQSLINFHPYKTREDFNGRVFDTGGFWTNFGLRPSGNWSFDLGFCLGDRIDVRNAQSAYETWVGPSTEVRLGRHIDLKLSHTFQRLSKEEEEIFSANLSELRGVYNFSPRSFIRAILQFQTTDRNPDLHISEVDRESKTAFVQLLFSYKMNPQTVFFLGYSDNREGSLDTEFQRVPLTQIDRTFFLKLGYAWRP
jgi:hypothetical protein